MNEAIDQNIQSHLDRTGDNPMTIINRILRLRFDGEPYRLPDWNQNKTEFDPYAGYLIGKGFHHGYGADILSKFWKRTTRTLVMVDVGIRKASGDYTPTTAMVWRDHKKLGTYRVETWGTWIKQS